MTHINNSLSGSSQLSGAFLDAIAWDVIRGNYGNGQDRIDRLGSDYRAVQDRVNQLLGYR